MALHLDAITGGPCAGKTTVIEAIKREYPQVAIVPESATMLLTGGFPPLERVPADKKDEWLSNFQHVIVPSQTTMERVFQMIAEANNARLMVSDRGLMDGAAYFPGGKDAFLAAIGQTEQQVFSRYRRVIHLESTATCNPSVYGKAGNATRYESLDQAIALEIRTREVWKNHPNWVFVSGAAGINDVVAQVLSLISEDIDVEIEKKFLIRQPFDWGYIERHALKVVDISQGYIVAGDEGELRIRRFGNEYFVASKGTGTIRRMEWERPFPKSAFDRLSRLIIGSMINKKRYFLPHGDYLVEVDVYGGPLVGLITFECEFATEAEAEAFVLPDWAKSAIDVTDESAFKNKNLALRGLPADW